LNPDDASCHNSRGLARALTNDYSGAVEDFKFVVEYAKKTDDESYPKREIWIAELKAGRNPFDEVTLNELRKQ
jgi:hypothetical protein